MPPITAILPPLDGDRGPVAVPVRVRLVPWTDPVVDAMGVDPRSSYVELFWLPVLGPSATWLLRRFADLLDRSPDGLEVDLGEVARSLGIGGPDSRHAPVRRALRRGVRFGLFQERGSDGVAVRQRLGPLPQRHLVKLPEALQQRHRVYELPGRASFGGVSRPADLPSGQKSSSSASRVRTPNAVPPLDR